MKIFLTAMVFFVTLVLMVAVAIALVLVLAGPHGGLLPRSFETLVLVLGWALVLGVPPLTARVAWRRLGRRKA